jgi:hypothetical protein
MTRLNLDAANAIEENLRYLIGLFSLFDASLRASAIGSLGYLELTESGNAGEGFLIETVSQINRLEVTVTGEDLSKLLWSGTAWQLISTSKTKLILACSTDDFWEEADISALLTSLVFSATEELDAQIILTASSAPEVTFDSLGPVDLKFRDGATWALLESMGLTWNSVEEQDMIWDDLEHLHK